MHAAIHKIASVKYIIIIYKIGVGAGRENFTFTTAKVGPKGGPIFGDVVTWRRGGGGKLC